MIILVDTDAGVTGIGEGGSPDLVAILAQSVIGRNAMNTELIWDHMYMDAFYSPGHEKLDALGGIDMALWDIKAKMLSVPLYMLFGGKVREHVELYATGGLPAGVQSGPTLKERAAATMAAGYYCYRVDGSIQPNPGLDGVLNVGRGGGGAWRPRGWAAGRGGAADAAAGWWGRRRWTRRRFARGAAVRLARARILADRQGGRTDPRGDWSGGQLVRSTSTRSSTSRKWWRSAG